MTATINANTTSGVVVTSDTSGALALQTGGTTALTVDSSQNVGIGTSSPDQKLAVAGRISISGSGYTVSSTNGLIGAYNGNMYVQMPSGNNLQIWKSTTDAVATFDQSGNLGLGVTPSAWNAGFKALQIGAEGALWSSTSTAATWLSRNVFFNTSSSFRYIASDYANALQIDNDGAYKFFTAPSGTAGNAITLTQAMTLDNSGNLLVGTTSVIASGKISISAALYTASTGISIQNTQTTYGSSTSFVVFLNGAGVQAGNIYQSAGTTVNYNTSSDARLKEDIGVATDTSVIDNTIIHDFTWKADSRVDRGVFAQEAYEVKPSAVGIGKDDLTESGDLVQPWSVDYSKYVPDLIVYCQQLKKSVQEQQAIIESLKARLDAANL